MTDIPAGFCQCGCGQRTTIATRTTTRRGAVKGEPRRYVRGHGMRGKFLPRYEVDPVTGCWNWLRTKSKSGYAMMTTRTGKSLHTVRAARHYYEQSKGAIPDGLQIDHLCRNPACVNPDHLEAVTPAENCRRRGSTKLTAEQVAEIRDLAGTMTTVEIAKRFGVSQPLVSLIIHRRTWK